MSFGMWRKPVQDCLPCYDAVYAQMVTIYGQSEQCSEACREILAIMQREATNANRG